MLDACAWWGPSAPSLAFKTICGLQGEVLGWSTSLWVLIALAMSVDPLGPQMLSSLTQVCDFGRVARQGSGPLEDAPKAFALALLDILEGESIWLELGEDRTYPQPWVHVAGVRLGLEEVLSPLPTS